MEYKKTCDSLLTPCSRSVAEYLMQRVNVYGKANWNDMEHPLLYLAVHLAFICSLRIGETVALTWDDIDFDQNLIRVRHTLQHVSREALDSVPTDGLVQVFPPRVQKTNPVCLLNSGTSTRANASKGNGGKAKSICR